MTVKAFFDTNVLVYAAIGTGKDEPKKRRAVELIESTDFGTSAQVFAGVLRDRGTKSGAPAFGRGSPGVD